MTLAKSGILAIETSGEFCSVAISTNQNDTFSSISYLPNSQSALLGNLIKNILISSETDISTLKAIAVGSGPGSYTGLRIGLSMAKGLCFANETPLVAVDSMQNIACQVFEENSDLDLVIVALDARRNEIYKAILDKNLNYTLPTSAIILGENSFMHMLTNKKVGIAGDGANKTLNFFKDQQDWVYYSNKFAKAETLLQLANEKVQKSYFESLESFEPNYIKPVFITQPK